MIRGVERKVTYISDEEIAALPDEPEMRLVALERIVRARYETACEMLGDNESAVGLQRRYMSVILPAARHYGISALSSWERPNPIKDGWQTYEQFIADVDYCIMALRLRNIEQANVHSVALDAPAKAKLQHLIEQVRETVNKLDISVAKKDALYKRINALQDEIDRNRTRYQAFAALMIEACDDAGEAAKRLEPVVRLVERVGSALGIAKRTEDTQPKLPPREERKRLDPPKRKKVDLEDIPF